MSAPPSLTPEQREQIAAALYGGNKIAAIKQFREVSGLGLAESKEIIERLENELRVQHPERFTAPPAAKGCTVGAMLLALLIVAVIAVTVFVLWKQ